MLFPRLDDKKELLTLKIFLFIKVKNDSVVSLVTLVTSVES